MKYIKITITEDNSTPSPDNDEKYTIIGKSTNSIIRYLIKEEDLYFFNMFTDEQMKGIIDREVKKSKEIDEKTARWLERDRIKELPFWKRLFNLF